MLRHDNDQFYFAIPHSKQAAVTVLLMVHDAAGPAGTAAFLVKGAPSSMDLGGGKGALTHSNGSNGSSAVHAHAHADGRGMIPLAAAMHRGSDASLRDLHGGTSIGTGKHYLPFETARIAAKVSAYLLQRLRGAQLCRDPPGKWNDCSVMLRLVWAVSFLLSSCTAVTASSISHCRVAANPLMS